MKCKILMITLMMGLMVSGCEKQEMPDTSKIEISETIPEKEEVKEDSKEELKEEPKEETQVEIEKEDIFDFSVLKNTEFYFGSGAGAWRTILHVAEDGSFWGEYSDSDMGSIGEGYPNGTYYYCAFEGEFSKPVKVNDYTYSVGIAEITYKNEPETKEIIDKMLYVYTEPLGIENANSLLLYLPGAPLEKLPGEYLEWVQMAILDHESKELPFYGLYNEKEQKGFSSYELMTPIDEMLASAERSANTITEAMENEYLTQTEMNAKSYELYEIWDKLLNDFWKELKNTLPEEEYQTLLTEQRAWIVEKETAVEKAGAEFAGGSMEALAKNMEAASMTEERVYELYKLLK